MDARKEGLGHCLVGQEVGGTEDTCTIVVRRKQVQGVFDLCLLLTDVALRDKNGKVSR